MTLSPGRHAARTPGASRALTPSTIQGGHPGWRGAPVATTMASRGAADGGLPGFVRALVGFDREAAKAVIPPAACRREIANAQTISYRPDRHRPSIATSSGVMCCCQMSARSSVRRCARDPDGSRWRLDARAGKRDPPACGPRTTTDHPQSRALRARAGERMARHRKSVEMLCSSQPQFSRSPPRESGPLE